MVVKVKALTLQKEGVVYIHFPQGQMPLRGRSFREFLELNGLQEFLVVFSPSAPEGAEEREMLLPTPHKGGWKQLREVLREALRPSS